MNSRRTFLRQVSGAALAAGALSRGALWAFPVPQGDGISVPGEDGMILRSSRFLDLETPVEYLNTWLTPASHFFVRNHMHEPSELDAGTWQLSVGGEVERPLTISLPELLKLEEHSVV